MTLPLGRAEIEADPPAPRSVPARSTRCSSSSPASGSSRARRSPRRTAPATFPGNPIMPGVKMVEALAQCGAVAVLSQPENDGRLVLFAGIDDVRFKRIVRPGDVLDLVCEVEAVRGPVGKGKVRASVGRRAGRARDADLRGVRRVIGRTTGRPISITGLGCHVPERVVTNDELAAIVDDLGRVDPRPHRHSRAPGRRRRPRRCRTSRFPPHGEPSSRPGSTGRDIDLDHRGHDHARHGVSGDGGAARRPARRRRRGRLRPLGRLHGLHVRARPGPRDDRLGPRPRGRS